MQITKRMIVRGALLTAVLIPALALPAAAHGPERKKVSETVVINAAPTKVWERIRNFNDMTWHPAVEKSEGEGGNAVDATRILTLKGGGIINEQLARYEESEMRYAYRITAVDVSVLPVTNYSSQISVKPADNGASLVEWRGAFYRGYPNNDPPENLNNDAAIAAVTAVYQAGLAQLKQTLESTN